LHDEKVLALALLRLKEILRFEIDFVRQTLRFNKGLSGLSCFGEILNDEFLDIWVSRFGGMSNVFR